MKWVIVASGPSVVQTDFDHLRRFRSWRVMVINNSWHLVPWAHALFASDLAWWERYGREAAARFKGERWTSDEGAARRFNANLIRRRDGDGLCLDPGFIHTGGNSGYQSVNLLYHMGARKIVLLGFDMHRRLGGHWHGDHEGMKSAPANHIAEWVRRFCPMANDLKREGIEVINATPGSDLPYFPMMHWAEALRC